MTPSSPSKILLGHSEIVMRLDNIVQINGTDHTYSVNDIREINKAIASLTNNKKVLILLVASAFSELDSDARIFMSTAEDTKYSLAEAYVVKSFAQRLILNFIIKVAGLNVPAKFFDEIEPAVEWLKKQE